MKLKLIYIIIISTLYTLQAQDKDIYDVARFGNVEDVQKLMKINSDTINVVNSYGYSPLILACYRGNTPVSNYLINQVSDLNYVSPQGTALSASVYQNLTQTVKTLIKAGAEIDIQDSKGVSPLMLAILVENKDIVEILLKSGANTKLLDKKGTSPFEYAIRTKNTNIINLLKNYL